MASKSNNAAPNPASVSDHSVSSMDSSSVVQQMSQPTSPASNAKAIPPPPAVAPQNPFEQQISVSSPPATVTISGTRRSSTEPRPDRTTVTSPDRPSAPSSPQQQPRSPVSLTPRIDQQPNIVHPQSAPPVSVPSLINRADAGVSSEQQRQYSATNRSIAQVQQPVFDDDETTEPSSAANTSNEHVVHGGGLTRFLEHTRRRLSTGRDDDDDDDEELMDGGALICGYLQKLGRNGKWQTRWFETDGECLSYYKSKKRNKLLATLDLEKVGAIEIETDDSKGCSFTIQVLGRLYHLRADSKAACKDWVITLNRVKEARLQQGNVKLVNPHSRPFDLLDGGNEDVVTPRVVVVANRQRTRAVAETQDWDQLIRVDHEEGDGTSSSFETKRRSAIGTVVLARWTKRRSSLSRLGQKLVRWARSLRRYRCTEIESEHVVQLDKYVHPPGHDDKGKRAASNPAMEPHNEIPGEGHGGWVDKELSSRSGGSDESPSDSPPKPRAPTMRSMSTASDDIRQIS